MPDMSVTMDTANMWNLSMVGFEYVLVWKTKYLS